MGYKRLNIILTVDDESRQKALDLANKIGIEQEEIFHIDDKNYFAHITVYSSEFPEENIPKIIVAVENVSADLDRFDLPVARLNTEDGFIDVEFEKTDRVVEINKTVVDVLNAFRNGRIREKYMDRIANGYYKTDQVEMIQKYGYANVLKLYRPHLTLGRLTSQDAAETMARNLSGSNDLKAVKITRMGISEMGSNGTCTNIIKEFDLR